MDRRIEVRSMFRDYTVAFGDDAVAMVGERVDTNKAFVVCDHNVNRLFANYLSPLLLTERHLLLKATEEEKTAETSLRLIETLVACGFRRDHTLVAVGGGITQDVVAFAASVLFRGVDWSFIPTTLLAQADSCIGSKTSINLGAKKNLIGNFWPPAFVAVDARFLRTLEAADISSGIGEMVHFFMYENSPMLRPVFRELEQLLQNRGMLLPYINEALRIKKRVVELDERDKNERHKFNYGHTFGHALESATGYSIPHGLAVMVGMDIANYLSMRLGLMDERLFEELHELMILNFPMRRFDEADIGLYFEFLMKDKKNIDGDIGCVLAQQPGVLVPRRIPYDALFRSIVGQYFSGPWWR